MGCSEHCFDWAEAYLLNSIDAAIISHLWIQSVDFFGSLHTSSVLVSSACGLYLEFRGETAPGKFFRRNNRADYERLL